MPTESLNVLLDYVRTKVWKDQTLMACYGLITHGLGIINVTDQPRIGPVGDPGPHDILAERELVKALEGSSVVQWAYLVDFSLEVIRSRAFPAARA